MTCGGLGNDSLSGQGGNDVLIGDAQSNVINFLSDDSQGGSDRLYDGDGIDTLFGNAKADRLFGGKGSDYFNGGPGNDIINGQQDDTDQAVGGSGEDTCLNVETSEGCE